jgi:hypothetical protein
MWTEKEDGRMSVRKICPIMSDARGMILCQGRNCAAASRHRPGDDTSWYCRLIDGRKAPFPENLAPGTGAWPGRETPGAEHRGAQMSHETCSSEHPGARHGREACDQHWDPSPATMAEPPPEIMPIRRISTGREIPGGDNP